MHQVLCLLQRIVRSQIERVGDNAEFGSLDLVNFLRLHGDGHILMDDADAALPGHGDCHPVLCYGIHPCAHHRNVQLDSFCEMGRKVDLIRNNLGIGRNQKYVVESNSFINDLSHRAAGLLSYYPDREKVSHMITYKINSRNAILRSAEENLPGGIPSHVLGDLLGKLHLDDG